MGYLLGSFFLTLLLILLPEKSYAWGPGAHIKLGLEVLEIINNISPTIADIIIKHPYHYLYGCISPDIIIGKKFAKEVDHCHNWEVGYSILKKSKNDPERAFSYGYLSHLAADVVAHNYFIPYQMIANFIAKPLRHTYWEMRYDGLLNDEVWKVFSKIPKDVRDESDKRLENILTMTIFSFSTNKKIFNGIMHISKISKWQDMIRAVSNRSQWTLCEHDVKKYYQLALQSVLDILNKNELALCAQADPNGKESLKTAKNIRKDMLKLHKSGKISDSDCHRIIKELKPLFVKKITTTEKASHTILIKRKKESFDT